MTNVEKTLNQLFCCIRSCFVYEAPKVKHLRLSYNILVKPLMKHRNSLYSCLALPNFAWYHNHIAYTTKLHKDHNFASINCCSVASDSISTTHDMESSCQSGSALSPWYVLHIGNQLSIVHQNIQELLGQSAINNGLPGDFCEKLTTYVRAVPDSNFLNPVGSEFSWIYQDL